VPVFVRYRDKTGTRAGRRLTADCPALLPLSGHSYRRVVIAIAVNDQSAGQSALTPLALCLPAKLRLRYRSDDQHAKN